MIVHIRIDSRVVHGQTTTRIIKEHPADGILIIDDEISADPFMLKVYRSAIGSLRVLSFSVDEAVRKLPEAAASEKRYVVVFKTTEAARRLVQEGYRFSDTVYVGPQPNSDRARLICKMLYLTDEQIGDLDLLHAQGTALIVNPAFTSPNLTWENARERTGAR